MEQESDRNRREAGEPLAVDLDGDVGSKVNEPKKHGLNVASERSQTPVALKQRKRKPSIESGLIDVELGGNGSSRLVENANSGGQKETRKRLGKKRNAEKRDKESGQGRMRDRDVDSEIKEMWETLFAGSPEDDEEAVRTVDDDKFIDDKGGDPSDHYGSDNKHSPSQAHQAEEEEEEDEIDKLFMIGKRKKHEISDSKIALLVEKTVAELHVAADEDAELNRQEKPAITKLRNLSLLTDIIPRKHLQQQFLDRGVLDALKAWLEPLPDKSMPNINVRAAVFKCLSDLTIDLEQPVRREQMKKSGIGKAVMFYYKYDKETVANRRAAKELVDKWSRAIYDISTQYEDIEIPEKVSDKRPNYNKYARYEDIDILEEYGSYRRPPVKKRTSGPSSSRQRASIPEAIPMDFAVRPKSKVDPDAVRTQAKQMAQGYHRTKLNKKMQRRKAPKQQQIVKPNP